MALANTAAYLAKIGRRVLMVDFDLEAPGLDSFDEFGVPNGHPGLVEYVCEYLANGRPAPIAGFVHETQASQSGAIEAKDQSVPFEGKLWLMPSGAKDATYNQKRLSINWQDLYDSKAGVEFFENFKADIEQSFQPDYVLVDSRTGLTDVGGVCTLHLPDLVVLLFALNEQNLQGTASVARVLRDAEKLPQLLTVATPVPNLPRESSSLLDERFLRAKELLGTDVAISLNYSSDVALRERILVWSGPSLLGNQYEALSDKLMQADPAGIDFLRRESSRAIEAMELDRAKEIGGLLKSDYRDRSVAWLTLVDIAKAEGNLIEMEHALREALRLSPSKKTFERIEALLRAKKRHDELLMLIRELLEASPCHISDLQEHLCSVAGELLQKSGQPKEALAYYEKALEIERASQPARETFCLVYRFNVAEARRRADLKIWPETWEQVVGIFEKTASNISSLPLVSRANQFQAMHIAYACVGNLPRAKELLDETAKLVSQASRQERLFSVADYEYVSFQDFLERNRQMSEALDRLELWDGMKLLGQKK